MLKKEYQILEEFIQKPWRKFTFREIKELSGKSSESYVYNSLKGFVMEEILREEKAGNVVLYSLKLDSMKTQSYAGFVSEYISLSRKHIPHNDLDRIISKIPTDFYIVLVAGSYAKGAQKKDSDLDLAVICDDSMEPKKIYAELRHECEMNIPRIHLYVFRRSEFLSMLLERKGNYGKEIAKNNLILSGGQEYFRIMGEAVRNGFLG